MISNRFLKIFGVSILLNYLHGIECIITKFFDLQPTFYVLTEYFTSVHKSVYFVFHGTLWIFLLFAFFLLKGGRWIFVPLVLYGTVFFTEFHHFVKGFNAVAYYPGMITSLFFPILGIFYWKELLKLWKNLNEKKLKPNSS